MRAIFREADEELLERELEDGAPIEPRWFAPIVPWILVNGACGIGVGHATDIPPFSFEEVCARVRLVLSSSGFLEEPREETALHVLRSTEPLKPYIRGFKGSLEPKTVTETREDGSVETKVKGYTIRGIVSEEGRTDKIRRVLHVTELPIELSIDGFKAHLDELKLGLKRSEAVKKKRVKWAKQKGKEELLNDGGTEEREAPLVYEYWDEVLHAMCYVKHLLSHCS